MSATDKNIAPRAGITYQLDPKTVIRSGYGRSFDIGVFGTLFGHVVTQNLPVLANQNLTIRAPIPPPSISPRVRALRLSCHSRKRSNPDPKWPECQNPREPPTFTHRGRMEFKRRAATDEIAGRDNRPYVGNKGSHTFAGDGQTVNPNGPAACIPASESVNGQGLCWNRSAPSTLPTASQTETSNTNYLRRYYAQFGWTEGLTYYHDGFDSHYNALQATLDKHFSQGLQFTARYAWQRAFNYANNDYAEIDRRVNYGRFDDLREQEFQLYGNYNLPFGRNQKFFNNVPTWANYLIGGYQAAGSLNWSSGLPFTPSYGECGIRHTERPLPTQQGGRHYADASHLFQHGIPLADVLRALPCFWSTRIDQRTVFQALPRSIRHCWAQHLLRSIVLQYRHVRIEEHSDPREHHSPVPGRCVQCLQLHQSGKSRKRLHRLRWRRDHHRDGNWSAAASTGILCDSDLLIRL